MTSPNLCYYNNTGKISVNMTIKKASIIFFLFFSLPVCAAQTTTDRFSYMNMEWWKNYNDEVLIEHLQTLYNNNHDLKIAALKTKQSEENVRLAGASQLPQVGFDGSLSRVMSGAETRFGNVLIPEYSQNELFLPLSASYEIDIWGQNYLNKKSARKQKEIIEQQERATYILMTSAFVADYYNLIKTYEIEKTLNEIIDLQSNIVKMTEKKYNAGLAPINELLNERQYLVKFEQDLNKITQNKQVLNNELIVLLGQNTDKLIEHSDFSSVTIPTTPESLSTTIIQNRPDLISSEDYAQKTGLDVRVARREFLPKFFLYGTMGFNAYHWNRMFAPETFMSNIGIAPTWDIFTGGVKLAKYRINKYEYKKAIEKYEKTILTSIQEVNDAMVEVKTTKTNLQKANEAYEIENQKHSLAEKQFTIGDSSKLEEMKSNVNLLIVKQHDISSKIDCVISTISLYKAVGGIDYTKAENL